MSITDRLEEKSREDTTAMQYMVVESTDVVDLTETIEVWMGEGWVCQGGIAISILPGGEGFPYSYTVHYAQAMVFDNDTSWVARDVGDGEE